MHAGHGNSEPVHNKRPISQRSLMLPWLAAYLCPKEPTTWIGDDDVIICGVQRPRPGSAPGEDNDFSRCMLLVIVQRCSLSCNCSAPPQAVRFGLCRTARALADDVAVTSCAHRCQEYNKMADLAANVAMDTNYPVRVYTSIERDIARRLENQIHP